MSKGVIYLSRVFKCKTCGAELDFDDDNEIVQCPYCGTRQSLLPENEDEQRRKIDSLLKRVFILLEDEEFKKADKYCERVLDIDPENALAYLGKLMAEKKVCYRKDLASCEDNFYGSNNYYRLMLYADDDLISEIESYKSEIDSRREKKRVETIYNSALNMMRPAGTEKFLRSAADKFMLIKDYKDSYSLAQECTNRADKMKRESEKFAEEQRIAQEKAEIKALEQAKIQEFNETINKIILFLFAAGFAALVYFTSK